MMSRRTSLGLMMGAAAAPAVVAQAQAQAQTQTPAQTPAITGGVDAHAHVFTRDLPTAPGSRYTVDYDATPRAFLDLLEARGLSRGVIVQPSFLGADNRYLLDTLVAHPDRFRGVVVVPETIGQERLDAMAGLGVVGVRLNLIGRPDPDLASPAWRSHLAALANLDWQVEIQCEAQRLPGLLPQLAGAGVKIVLDHLGRPDPDIGVDDPGFRYLLAQAETGRIWVKLSGEYRIGATLAAQAAARLLDAFGPSRLVWGSDWPHTQFEAAASYAAAFAALSRWAPSPDMRRQILVDTPVALFGFYDRPVAAAPSLLKHAH
ncbi:amidohydrolase family protein [Brevundimonas sp.]|jgi:predicted TIM-barrel fold metal-dependent hydrolase|uniref:amidohydrolase family protein n=1 Tax=Brevundimonas sp. TaxID=1871086 RepID=UPI0037BFBD92